MLKALTEVCRMSIYACFAYIYSKYQVVVDGSIIFVIILILDILVWVYKSYVLYSITNPNWFSMRKILIWFSSKLVFFSITLATIMMTSFVYSNNIIFNKAVIGIFLMSMFVWVLHNGVQIAKWEEVPEWNAIAVVFEVLYIKIKSLLELLITKITNI